MKHKCLSPIRGCGIAPYHKDGEDWNGDLWIQLQTLWFQLEDGRNFKAPIGRITDIGSVPDRFKGFVDDSDESLAAFLGHDELCKKGSIIADDPNGRKIADNFLYEVARQKKQTWWRSVKTWFAVKVGDLWTDYFTEEPKQDLEYVERYLEKMIMDLGDE